MHLTHFIKSHPYIMEITYNMARVILNIWSKLIRVQEKTMIFASFGGRNYDDSPRALYEYIINMDEFKDWTFYWGLIDPDAISIPRAKSIKFGTLHYWRVLLSSRVWITNGGIDRGINLNPAKRIIINTWHGTPMKKIEGEENNNSVLKKYRMKRPLDKRTIRCCQSDYDKEIFARVFNASKNSFLQSGLPRNDSLLKYSEQRINGIKAKLKIDRGKRVLLYMPTYREYITDEAGLVYADSPISIEKWENQLGSNYVLLVRAHYAVAKRMNIGTTRFAIDVSNYSPLSDLYAISDVLISDYSSSFFDYAILGRPLICFAYDEARYEKERGLYISLEELPCKVLHTEDEVIDSILNLDYEKEVTETKRFASKYLPYEGHACEVVTKALIERLKNNDR